MTRRARRRRVDGPAPPPPAAAVQSRWHRSRVAIALLTFTVTFATLEIVAHSQRSGTWDEPMHLASGYAALVDRDYLLDPAHPPFARMWAALPLLAMSGIDVDRTPLLPASSQVEVGGAYEFARRFLYVNNDAERLINVSRNMIVILGVVLGILVFAWTHEWLGFTPAALALAFYVLEPNLGAHASLVTTDFAVTCAIFGAVYFLWRTCRRVSLVNVTGLAVFFALAAVTKFSGLILVPIAALLVTLGVCWRALPARKAAMVAVVVSATTVGAIWTVYAFQYSATPDGRLLMFERSARASWNAPVLAAAVGWVDSHRLLPNAFTQGLLYSQVSGGQLPGYLAGHISQDGWWYYFPAAFLLKTPAALLVLTAAGLVVLVRRRAAVGGLNASFVLTPVVVYVAVAMTSDINIGLRHILPIYPFVVVTAAAGASGLLTAGRRAGPIALAALILFWCTSYANVYPHTLTFFNRFAGGPSNGHRYLTDSNLDWGQHLELLKKWMDAAGVRHVNLAYFGTADPAYYGIDCTHLPGAPTFALPQVMRPRLPGYVAISATVASGVYLDPRWRLFYRPFRDRAPAADIGHSIKVYWVDQWPAADEPVESHEDAEAHAGLADALLFGQQWIDQAIVHYRAYLTFRPDDARATSNLGLALAALGRFDEAIVTSRRAATIAPSSAWPRRVLAEVLLDAGRPADAAVEAERALALSPGDPAVHDVLGVTLVLRGRVDEARRQFERALALNPGYGPAREHLSRLQSLTRR